MNTTRSSILVAEVPGYAELQREMHDALRAQHPEWRISSTDWVDGGWNINESVKLAGELKQIGVDLIDCSSGGNVPHAKIPVGPGYQTMFAERIRRSRNHDRRGRDDHFSSSGGAHHSDGTG
jgi:2,4-dienoyl-CoA reductase-like NADH-dependent reductase (Old Yellow Enzyme family)